jgi:hypothetical protein
MNHHRYRRLSVAALGLALLAAGCDTGSTPSSSAGSVTPTTLPPSAVPDQPTSSTAPLRAAELMLAADGLGPVTLGTQAAVAMNRLTQALGPAEKPTMIPPTSGCDATRIFRWKNFAVLINEVTARSGGKPGLVGWRLGVPAAGSLDLETDKGIGLGATVRALKAAYGESVTIGSGPAGPTFEIATPKGAISGQLDGPGDAARIRTLQAGTVCGLTE